MLLALLLAALGRAGAFLLRAACGSSLATVMAMKDAFEPLRGMASVETITVHTSADSVTGPVQVVAHVVCQHGFETWGVGSGDGVLRACEDCATDTLAMLRVRES